MSTVLSLRNALLIVVSLAALGVSAFLGLPRWVAVIVAGLACGLVLGLPGLVRRLRGGHGRAAAAPDPRLFARALTRRVRDFVAGHEPRERAVYFVASCGGLDLAALLRAAEFSREELAEPAGPVWSLWRRRTALCVEIPVAYLGDAGDDAWRALLALLPVRALRSHTRGGLVLAPWSAVEAAEPAAGARLVEPARERLRGLARRLGLALPVHVVLDGADDPLLGALVAPPLRLARERAWGVRLPFCADAAACEQAAVRELSALGAGFASRLVERLGDETADDAAPQHGLLTLVARLRRLVAPAAALAAGVHVAEALWPRGIYLTGRVQGEGADRRACFADDLFAGVLAEDVDLWRPNAAAQRRRRLLLGAAGVALNVGGGLSAIVTASAYSDNAALLAEVQRALPSPLPGEGPVAIPPIARVRQAAERLEGHRPYPGPFSALATARGLRPRLHDLRDTMIHRSLFTPSLVAARDLLCPGGHVPEAALDDRGVDRVEALLGLYILGTGTTTEGKPDPRDAAEAEVEADPGRVAGVVRAGAQQVWTSERAGAREVREAIAELLIGHIPLVAEKPKFRVARDQACVQLVRARLDSWRAQACSEAGLRSLVPGKHRLREFLQTTHDTLARTDDLEIPELFTAAGYAAVVAPYAAPERRCGRGGWLAGVTREADAASAGEARRDLFERYARDYIAAWEALLGAIALSDRVRECKLGLQTVLRGLIASEGPLYRLPQMVEGVGLPPVAAPERWDAAHVGVLRDALDPYAAPVRASGPEGKPPVDALRAGVAKLLELVQAGRSQTPQDADVAFDAAKNLTENACSLVDEPVADLLRRLLKPTFDQALACHGRSEPVGLDPWCAEVAGPFHRGLGLGYPFVRDSRREVPVADLCRFYCPQKGSPWTYYRDRLAGVLLAAGDGRYVPYESPGFASFRGYNPALARFYARTFRLSALLFPLGDAPLPAIQLAVYIPPIDDPDVEVDEAVLTVGSQVVRFTNAKERWPNLTWPADESGRGQPGASLHVEGRYRGEPFSEDLQESGAWALFRLLERGEARWHDDHLRFRFSIAELHGATIDLAVDAGPANELLLDREGRFLAAFRSPGVPPPLQLRTQGPRCAL